MTKEKNEQLVKWTKYATLATCTMALGTFIMIFISMCSANSASETVNLMREDSIQDLRPYIFITAGPTQQLIDGSEDVINFNLQVINSGKSAGRDVEIEIKKANLIGQNFVDGQSGSPTAFQAQLTDVRTNINVIPPINNMSTTLFPSQQGALGDFRLERTNLEKEFANGKAIYLLVTITYKGPKYEKIQKTYTTDYEMILWNRGDGYSNIRFGAIESS